MARAWIPVLAAVALIAATVVYVALPYTALNPEVVLVEKAAAGSAAAALAAPGAPVGAIKEEQKKAIQSAFEKAMPPVMRKLLNPKIDPCTNFHEWACGTFESTAVIPADKSSWTYSWDGDGVEILNHLHSILEVDKNKPGFYYRACMDMKTIDAAGIKPLKPWIQLVNDITDAQSLARVVAKFHMAEVPAFFDWFVGTDDQDSTRALLYLDKGGLSLPDATYYVNEDTVNEHRPAFLKYVKTALTLSGYSAAEADVMALTTFTIETEIASHSEDWGDGDFKYNETSIGTQFPHFDWESYIVTVGHGDLKGDRIFLTNPAWFSALDQLLAKYTLADLKRYLVAHLVINVSPLMTAPFLENNLDLDRDLYGIGSQVPRWKKCTRATRHALPFLVSKLFIDKYFPIKARKLAISMLENIREAFKEDIESLSWMSNQTRVVALEKLNKIFFEVGYPDQWPQYGFLVMLDTYFDNAMRASEWRSILKLERLRHPIHRRAWDVTPVSVNAFYYNGVNGVFMPTGILQPPFFDWNQPLAHNYGSIGAIMGHELTHGFDSTGAQYNANGERKDWWDDKTLDEFDQRKTCVSDYYSTFEIYGEHVSGSSTLDEDIADIGGVKMAYKAYLIAEKKRGHTPTLYDRRMFWTAFAQTWCGRTRKQTMLVDLKTDEHAPDQFRIQGAISQNRQFAHDFSCPAGSPMNPKTRCELW